MRAAIGLTSKNCSRQRENAVEHVAQPSTEGLHRIGALYHIERDLDALPRKRRHAIRAERTVPSLADLRTYMASERRRPSGSNVWTKAL